MSSPLVSVLVPVFNMPEYLPMLLDSVRGQSEKDFEVIVCDDGSTDGTAAAYEPFLDDPRFRCIRHEKNMGLQQSMCDLMRAAQGTFWCMPGADDILEPDFCRERLRVLEGSPSAVLAFGPAVIIGPDGSPCTGQPAVPLDLPRSIEGRRMLRILIQHNVVTHPSVMVRRDVAERVLPRYPPFFRFAPDWNLWILLAATGGGFLHDPVPRLRYRVHPTSLTIGEHSAVWRTAEARMVPLVALSQGSVLSPDAQVLWSECRTPLYVLWLRRALKLRLGGHMDDLWLARAADAYYGCKKRRVSLFRELTRHLGHLVYFSISEAFARRRQLFGVAGLATLDDDLFDRARCERTP